jgi:hypothetical protein
MKNSTTLKPQDILVCLKLLLIKRQGPIRLIDLAVSLAMSPSEVSQAINRATFAGLMEKSNYQVFPEALKEVIFHGLRFFYPARPGLLTRGIPTAHSAAPLNKKIKSSTIYVWPDPNGEVRGESIDPIYSSVPSASMNDPKLYEVLSLIDALRVGNAREKKMATEALEIIFSNV